MPKLFKYLLDFAALALLYCLWLRPKWQRDSKPLLAANTVMFLYLFRRSLCDAHASHCLAAILLQSPLYPHAHGTV